MSVHEQLRAFLEQRRELGESEFVLDQLRIEDVMKIIGAKSAPTPAGAPTRPTLPSATPPQGAKGSAADERLAARDSYSANWRETLRSSGATPRGAEPTPAGPHSSGPPPRSQDTPGEPTRHHHPVPTGSNNPVQPESPPLVDLAALPPGLSVGTPNDAASAPSPWATLQDIAQAVAACTRCPLAATAKNPVPGHGNPNADFVCVGEAPGATEDEQGLPFVGQAGQLLTKILAAINLTRDDVFICNVLKHRPPGNRNPMREEVAACSPFLVRQIELLRPRVILALGTFASQTLLQTKEPIGKLRGRLHRYYGVPVIVTYHPAALLRNPSWKRPTWEDVQLARKILDRDVAS